MLRNHHWTRKLLAAALPTAAIAIGGLDAAPATQDDVTAFPQVVPFVGVQNVFSRNLPGDAIVITAVRGTANTISVGNTYQIQGTYTLASHDRAELIAYETDTQPNTPHRDTIDGQSCIIQKGAGTFTLRLRVLDPGCPHVSFYPLDHGQSFGGEYFGTGDFLPPASWQAPK